MTEQIQAEVRLYFNGRQNWDTEFFKATSNTDVLNKAMDIAKRRHADHFNCGLATSVEEYHHSGPVAHKPKGLGTNPRDQVKAIQGFLGVEQQDS